MKKSFPVGRIIYWTIVGLTLLLMSVWAMGAIWFLSSLSPAVRTGLLALYGLGALCLPLLLRLHWQGLAVSAGLFLSVVIWYFSFSPSNTRDWQPDLAVLPWAEIAGEKVTVHNIRNCDYRTETDFTCHYYDRSFDLTTLKTLDLFLVYWGSPNIAHTMLSFGFQGQGNVCFSIETRKEKGEEYSAVKGFFRQYEKAYIVADERDVVRLRTNYRNQEDAYLYRLNVPPEVARKIFLDYLGTVNHLKNTPEWYNALFGNCTTSIRQHTIPYNPNARLDWRLIVNGYIDQMLYERNLLNTTIPFTALKQQSYINKKAQAADQSPDFSQRIREGLPLLLP